MTTARSTVGSRHSSPARGATRPEVAADHLAGLAESGAPGRHLGTKEELRLVSGVSVGTFNEALRLAQNRGAVTVRRGPGGGIFAGRQSALVRLGNSVLTLDAGADAAAVAEAVRLRDALDPLLIEDALAHATDETVGRLRGALDRMRAAVQDEDPTAFVRANWALHACVAEVSPHPIVRSIYLGLLEIIENHTLSVAVLPGSRRPDDLDGRYQVHVELVEAIAARDRSRALEVCHRHNTSLSPVPGTD